jgi:hypothetical protein
MLYRHSPCVLSPELWTLRGMRYAPPPAPPVRRLRTALSSGHVPSYPKVRAITVPTDPNCEPPSCDNKPMRVRLGDIAHTRSGDKGDTCNIGVIANNERHYPDLAREVTAERVKSHFGELVQGRIERFELPNLGALNFLLHESLGGGGTVSLRTDAQGKTFGAALLSLEIELPE